MCVRFQKDFSRVLSWSLRAVPLPFGFGEVVEGEGGERYSPVTRASKISARLAASVMPFLRSSASGVGEEEGEGLCGGGEGWRCATCLSCPRSFWLRGCRWRRGTWGRCRSGVGFGSDR